MKQQRRREGDKPIMCEEISSTFERNLSNLKISHERNFLTQVTHVNQRHYANPRDPTSRSNPKCMFL